MAVTVNITDRGQSAPISTLTSTLAWIGVSSAGGTAGTVGSIYQLDAPGLVPTNIGYGPGPEGIAAGIRTSLTRQVFARIAGSIPGTLSAVTQSGSGPAITIAGTPYDSATPKLTIQTGGALGTALFQLAMDGSTNGPVINVPAQTAAQSAGTADLSALTYSTLDTLTLIATPDNGVASTVTFTGTTSTNFLTQVNAGIGPAKTKGSVDLTAFTYSSLDTLTLIFTPTTGGAVTCTFASTSSGNFLTQINTALGSNATAAIVSNNLVVTDAATGTTSTLVVGAGTANSALGLTAGTYKGAQASIIQGKYLLIVDGTTGTTSGLTIGAGTANTALGLTAGASTGTAATYIVPNSNVTVTFPTGTYVTDETYTWTQTEPKFTASDLAATITALQTSGVYFRDIVLLSSPIDGADTRALANQASTSLATMRGAIPKVFAVLMMNSAIGLPSTITANDTDVKANMQGHANDFVCVAHGDCYMQGTAVPGSFRRPLVFSLGIREASYPISTDPGSRELPQLEETSPTAPDLVTLARSEDVATIKMQTAGFTVMRSEFGASYFVQGLTRSISPKFRYLPIMRTTVECARILYAAGKRYENASRFLNSNGTVRESDAVAIETSMSEEVLAGLSEDISGIVVNVDRAGVVATTNTLNIRSDMQPLGYFYTVVINLGVVDTFT